MPGYPDFRRQVDADASPLFSYNINVTPQAGTVIDGPYYVGSFEKLAVVHEALTGIRVTFNWYDDAALTRPMGTLETFLTPSVSNSNLLVHNLGRFVTVTRRQPGGGAWSQLTFIAWGTNRASANFAVPSTPAIQNHSVVALGAGLTDTLDFPQMTSDLATVAMFAGAAASSFRIDAYLPDGSVASCFGLSLAANTVDTRLITLPPTSCRSRILNQGAVATNNSLIVTARLG